MNGGMQQPVSTAELRDEIADIDSQIIDLIATRVDITDELAKAKRRSGQDYWDSATEAHIIERYCELCQEVSLSKDDAEKIAKLILAISRERQKKIYDSTD
ncbi:Chorismate mutase [Thermoplasmatales archaeon BRNA1]|nr:Chorismate mutase [Thermoplasmatales archaeon BRNA1]